jgi:hypothetical protein
MSDREDPYCTHCGSGSLRYDYECASGIVYQCKRCGNEFQWSPPKDDEGTAEIRAPRDTGGMSNELPPLPEPNYPAERDYADAWTADQMQAYASAAVAAERERCAKVCESLHDRWKWHEAPDSSSGPKDCAAAIRKG